jgi:dTDP-4-dehydrorhamnose 3,5-epimerase
MAMRVELGDMDGLALLRWEVHEDERGSFARTYCRAALAEAGLPFEVVQVNVSRNPARHTLRGLHFQQPPYAEPKIVACLRGRIWDVAVDMRPESATYRQWRAFELSGDGGSALHLAAGLAHGFITFEPDSEVLYLMGAAFAPQAASGLRWDDPAIGITWPAVPAVISDRDLHYPLLVLDQ